MTVTPLALGLLVDQQDSAIYENVAAIFYMSIFGMVGGLSGTYFDFFSAHAQTLLSHINIIENFVRYSVGSSATIWVST